MKKMFIYIFSIFLVLPVGIQARSVREYIQDTPVMPPIVDNTLNLSQCGLTSLEGLEDIPHPENIQMIDVAENQLETIPAGIFDRFVNLRRLDLSNNTLRELPVQIFSSLTQLTGLDIRFNQLTALDVNLFQNQTELDTLDLSNNHLCMLPAEIFSTTGKLNFLELNDNRLQELPEAIFNKLTKLRRVVLANNKLNVLRANVFQDTTDLTSLELSGNHLRTLPAGIFSATRNLRTICLNNNKLQALPQDIFAGLTRLGALYVDDNYLLGTEEEFKQRYLGNRQLDDFDFKSTEQQEEEFFHHEVLALLNNPELDQDNIDELVQELKLGVDQEEQSHVAILRDLNGNTVLHRAIMLRNQELVSHKKLVSQLLRLWPHLLKVKNNGGRTPLHVAAGLRADTQEDRDYAYKIFMRILARGRKHRERLLMLKDNDGNTPIQLALKNKQYPIFQALLSLVPEQLLQQQ